MHAPEKTFTAHKIFFAILKSCLASSAPFSKVFHENLCVHRAQPQLLSLPFRTTPSSPHSPTYIPLDYGCAMVAVPNLTLS